MYRGMLVLRGLTRLCNNPLFDGTHGVNASFDGFAVHGLLERVGLP